MQRHARVRIVYKFIEAKELSLSNLFSDNKYSMAIRLALYVCDTLRGFYHAVIHGYGKPL